MAGVSYFSRTRSRILSFSLAFWRSVTLMRTSEAVDSKAPLAKRSVLARDQRVEKRRNTTRAATKKKNEPISLRNREKKLSRSPPRSPPDWKLPPRKGKLSKKARSEQTIKRPMAIVVIRLRR